MKKICLLVVLSLMFNSCFRKEHKIDSIEINGFSESLNNLIELCLEESIGYESYHLKFVTTLKDGTIINTSTTLMSPTDSEKRCFEIYLGASFTHRHTSKEERELIKQISRGNISEMEITIFDEWGKDKIRTQMFNNL